jgi:excisionase family DNA binding protein
MQLNQMLYQHITEDNKQEKMMEENLTSRQVQEILKVDRITIYRMLADGRLKGVKIGQQWRFPRSEVERLLKGELETVGAEEMASTSGFPTHCVQTIQNLFSDVSQISALVVDMQGSPLTHPSSMCSFCRMMSENLSSRSACQASWRQFAQRSQAGDRHFTCHAGLHYVGAPVMDGAVQLALFLTGEYYWFDPGQDEARRLSQLVSAHGLPEVELKAAAAELKLIPPEKHAEVENWPVSAARAVQSILQERSGFIQRLQQISSLTQIS